MQPTRLTPIAAPGTTSSVLRQVLIGLMMVFLASTFFSIAVNSIALGLLAILWLAVMALERKWSVSPTPLDWFFLAYVIAELCSTALSVNPLQSLEFSKRLLLIGIVYLLASVVPSRIVAGRLLAVLLGTAAIVGLLGVLKLVFADPNETVRLGIFQFYMTTSGLMMIALLLVAPFAIHPGTPRTVRLLAIAGLIPVAVSLYATVTRGAYLAAAAGVIFIALVRNRRLVIPVVVILLAAVLFAPPYIESRIRSIVDLQHPDNASRLMLWKTGLRMVHDFPIFGIGDIDMHALYLQYMDPGDPAQHGHFHNMAMQFLVTLGGAGFLVVLAMFIRIFQTEWRVYRRVRADWLAGSATLGAMAVFIGLQVSGLTEWSFGDQELAVLFWTTVGLTLAFSRLSVARGAEAS
jgi:O-antigen ligase